MGEGTGRYPKVIIYDLETAKSVGTFYQAYDTNIIDILQGSYILSFSYVQYDHARANIEPEYVPKVKTVCLADFPARFKNNPFDDYDVVKALHGILYPADNRIAYNGKKFDDRMSNARFAAHGLPIIGDVDKKMIDPLRIVKRHLKLEKNNLDYVCKFFGIEGKTAVTYGQVDKECSQLENWWNHKPIEINKKAWGLMNKYCKNDTAILYKLYTRIRGYDNTHPNLSIWTRQDGCVVCGGTDFISNGLRPTTTNVYRRLFCKTCGHPNKERTKSDETDYKPIYVN